MADPRIRGKHAFRASALLTPGVKACVENTVQDHAQLVVKQGGSIMSLVQTLIDHEQLTRWCAQVGHNNERNLTFSDAAAALISLYLKQSVDNHVLHGSYKNQVAAILAVVLREPVRNTRLYMIGDTGSDGHADQSGAGRAFVWDNILLPLADLVLQSLAAMRLMPELCAGDPTLHPFAWSPKADNLHDFLRIALLGGLKPASVNAQFLRCRFVGYLTRKGLASTVPVEVVRCEQCKRRFLPLKTADTCKDCGSPLVREIRPMCLSTAFIAGCSAKRSPDGRIHFEHSAGSITADAGSTGAPGEVS